MTNKQRVRRRNFRWAPVLLMVLVMFGVFHIVSQIIEYNKMLVLKEQYDAELAEATAIYEEKMEEIELLNDDAYVARIAREKLGMVQNGELPVVAMQSIEEITASAE